MDPWEKEKLIEKGIEYLKNYPDKVETFRFASDRSMIRICRTGVYVYVSEYKFVSESTRVFNHG